MCTLQEAKPRRSYGKFEHNIEGFQKLLISGEAVSEIQFCAKSDDEQTRFLLKCEKNLALGIRISFQD